MKRYAIWAAILFMTGGTHAQDVIKQDVSAKTVTEAKIGDVLLRKGAVETIKIDASGKLNTKVFAAPQWDQTGKPLVEYDTTTGQVKAKSRYARFVPDEATGKLTVDRQVTNTGVKEFYTVPDEKTTKLSWTVDTDAETVEWDNAGKRLVFYGFGGLYMFESPPPVAWDADRKPVGVTVAYDKGVLTYGILEGDYRYPVTVDPTVNRVNMGAFMYLNSIHANYSAARDATQAGSGNTNKLYVGQATGYSIYRSIMYFPNIPTMSTASACTLFVDGSGDYSTSNFNIYLLTATAAKPIKDGSLLNLDDWHHFDGWAASGSYTGTVLNDTWDTSSFSADWNKIIFNTSGKTALNTASGDTLWLAMLSREDYDNSAPANDEYVGFEGGTAYLSFTYTTSTPSSPTRRTPFANDPTPIFRNDPIPIWRR